MKLDGHDLELLCRQLNDTYVNQSIPPHLRSGYAMLDLHKQFSPSLDVGHDHPISVFVRHWFDERLRLGIYQSKPSFIGVYFYDQTFWPINIGRVFGSAPITLRCCLSSMPESIIQDIYSSDHDLSRLWKVWHDCLICSSDQMNFSNNPRAPQPIVTPLGRSMFSSGCDQLVSATDHLLSDTLPTNKAIDLCRFSIEMVMKALAAELLGKTKDVLRKRPYSHSFQPIASELMAKEKTLLDNYGFSEFLNLERIFPEQVENRYSPGVVDFVVLSKRYETALAVLASAYRYFYKVPVLEPEEPKPIAGTFSENV